MRRAVGPLKPGLRPGFGIGVQGHAKILRVVILVSNAGRADAIRSEAPRSSRFPSPCKLAQMLCSDQLMTRVAEFGGSKS
jgi:hypothetical protein